MSSDLILEGKKFISAKDAKTATGYTSDYIGQLCRGNKIPAQMVGRSWYVDLEALLQYQKDAALSKTINGYAAVASVSKNIKKEATQSLPSSPSFNVETAATAAVNIPAIKSEPKVAIAHPPVASPVLVEEKVSKNFERVSTTPVASTGRSPFFAYLPDFEKSLIPELKKKVSKGVEFKGKDFGPASRRVMPSKVLETSSSSKNIFFAELQKKATALAVAVLVVFGSLALGLSTQGGENPHVATVSGGSRSSEITEGVLNLASVKEGSSSIFDVLSLGFGGLRNRFVAFVKSKTTTPPVSNSTPNLATSDELPKELAVTTSSVTVATSSSSTKNPAVPVVATSTKIIASVPKVVTPAVVQNETPVVKALSTTASPRIIERIIETGGVTSDAVDQKLKTLQDKIYLSINALSAQTTGQYNAAPSFYPVASAANRIDKLTNVTIDTARISGATITNSSFSGTINITDATATSSFAGGLTFSSLTDCGKLYTNTGGDVLCGVDAGGTGIESNWLFFNGSGIRLGTTSNQIVVGASATSSLAKLEVQGNTYINGNLGIGTSSPYAPLSVLGEIVGSFFTATTSATSSFAGGLQTAALNVTGSGTSTFAQGINIASGCFSVNGTCLSATGGSGTPGGANTQVQFNNNGAFGGVAAFTFNSGTSLLTSPSALFTFATTTNFLATGSSTLQNFTFINATGSAATTTNSFATTASSTNLFATTLTAGNSNLGSLTVSNFLTAGSSTLQNFTGLDSTTTNATATSFFATSGTFTNLFANSFSLANLLLSGSSTLQNFTAVNATTTNSTSTTLFASTLVGTNAFINSLLTSANFLATGSSTLQNFTFVNATGSAATTTNFSTGVLTVTGSATSTFASGISAAALDITGSATSTIANGLRISSGGLALSSANCTLFNNGGKLTTDSNGNIICGNDTSGSGGSGTDVNWTFFNGSGISVATTSNQVLIGASATSSLAKLEVQGNIYINGNLGIGTSSPYARLSVAGEAVAGYFTATTTSAVSSFGQLLTLSSSTLQNFTFINATGSNATTTGAFNVGTTLTVSGSATSTFTSGINTAALNVTGAATSTFANGINLATGCYSINGVCIGNGSVSGSGIANQISYFTGSNTLAGSSGFTFNPNTGLFSASSALFTFATTTNFLATGSSTLQNFTFVNATGSNATTTNLSTGTLTVTGNATTTFGGGVQTTALNVTGAGTSTFGNGLSIASGCFSINGTCVAGSGGVSAGGANGNVQFNNSGVLGGDSTFTWDNTAKLLTIGRVTITSATTTNFLATGSSTLQNFTFINATGSAATTTNSFATTASSTNLFATIANIGTALFGKTTSTEATSTNLFATSFTATNSFINSLLTSANFLATGSSTLQNFTFVNATGSSATTTNLSTDTLTVTGGATTTISSGLQALALNITGSATSTFAQGINIASGCYAYNGTCIGGAGSGVADNPGAVQFNNGGGTFGGDSTTFFWDNTNKRLGIGTSSPYAKLSVAGAVVAESFTATSTTATSTIAGIFAVGSSTPSFSSFFTVGTSSALALTVDKQTGFFGIGSTSPSALFSVVGQTPPAGDAPLALYVQGGTGGSAGSAGGGVTLQTGIGNGAGAGGTLTLAAGAGGSSGRGGNVAINAGVGNGSQNGGALSFTSGNGGSSGAGGAISITSGAPGGNLASGAITIASGAVGGSGTPGTVSIQGGANTPQTGSGGTVSLSSGASLGSGSSISLTGSNSAGTGGGLSLSSGAGGSGGNGGALTISTGGGSADANAGNLTISGGAGNGTGTGGSITLTAGNGGATNVNGANIVLNGGIGGGTGWSGNVLLGNSRGNVGIGTSTPRFALQVASSTAPQLALSDGTLTSNHFTFRSIGSNFYIATASPSTLATSTMAALTITSNGFLGIGSTTPTSRLSVEGNTFVNGNGTTTGSFNVGNTLTVSGSGTSTTLSGALAITGGQLSISGSTPGPNIFLNYIATSTFSSGLSVGALTVTGAATSTFANGLTLAAGCVTVNNTCVGGSNFTGSGAAGQVTFFSGTTALAGSNNFFYDTNKGALGLGTTTPAWSLQLASSTAPQLALTDPNGATDAKHGIMRFANGNFYFGSSTDALSATSTYLTINGRAGGNVGIGSTSPSSRLTIQDTGSTLNNGGLLNVALSTGAPGLFVDNTGRVAIGSQVFPSTATFVATANGGTVSSLQNGGAIAAFYGGAGGASTDQIVVHSTGSGGEVELGTFNGTGALAGAVGFVRTPLANDFFLGTNNTERMRITAGGNFGIGTTTSRWLTQLATGTAPQLALSDGSLTSNHFTFRSVGNTFAIATASPSTFATSTTNVLSVTANGLVGIGVNTPTFQLDVAGGFRLGNANNNSSDNQINGNSLTVARPGGSVGPQFYLQNDSATANSFNSALVFAEGTTKKAMIAYDVAAGGLNKLVFQLLPGGLAGNTEANTILTMTDGYSGFGSTTPNWLLQLATGTAPQLTLTDPTSITTNHWSFRNAGGLFYLATSSASTFATSSMSAFSINANGLVGIGSTTPTSRLSVEGNTFVNGNGTTTGSFNVGSNFTVSGNGTTTRLQSTIVSGNFFFQGQDNTVYLAGSGTSTFSGGVNIFALNLTGSATSTAANGINLSGGCFAVNNTCLPTNGTTGSGSSGQVTFWNGTNSLTGSNNFFYNNTQGTLGLGTTTPNWLLQLASSTAPQLALTDPNGGTNAKHGIIRFANGNFYFGTSSDALSSTSTLFTLTQGTSTFATNLTVTGNLNIATTTDKNSWLYFGGNPLLTATGTSLYLGLGAGTSTRNENNAGNFRNNTAIGYQSMQGNTTGTDNTALGWEALYSNTTGTNNTVVGSSALVFNTSGVNNVAIGSLALYVNQTGQNNTAVGGTALANNTGSFNTAFGNGALYSNQAAAASVAVGWNALLNQTAGASTTALGAWSGRVNDTGIYNTYLGAQSDAGVSNLNYSTAIGAGAIVNKSNAIVLGGVGTVYGVTVGIGTTTPNWLLQLASSTAPQLALTDPNGGTDAKHGIIRFANGNFYIGTSSDALTSTTTYVTINKFGGVGIGTTTNLTAGPVTSGGTYLSVLGGINVQGKDGNPNNYARFGVPDGNGVGGIVVNRATVSQSAMGIYLNDNGVGGTGGGFEVLAAATLASGRDLRFLNDRGGTSAGDETLRIMNTTSLATNGFVGIGSSTPWAKLSVTGGAGQTAPLFAVGSSSASINYLTLTSVGNLGLGTTTPAWSLQVASATPYVAITDTDASTNAKHWILTNTNGVFAIGTSSDALSATSSYFTLTGSSTTFTSALNVTSNATSTYTNGIQITSGCFSVNGTCLSTNGSTNAAGGSGAVQFANSTSFAGDATNFFWDNSKKALGIGTSTPAWLLQLASSTAPQLALTDPNGGTNAKHGIIRFANGNFYIGTSSDALNATTTLFTIASTTAVGIGTVNPTGAFEVKTRFSGDSMQFTDINSTSNYINFAPTTGSGGNGITIARATDVVGNMGLILKTGNSSRATIILPTSSSDLQFTNDQGSNQVGTEIARFYNANDTHNGALGLASSTPWAHLSVKANSGETAPLFAIGGSSNQALLQFLPSGALGLGTTTPNWMVQLASSTAPQLALTDSGAGTNLKHWVQRVAGGNFYLATSSDAYATSTVPAIMVNSSGYVGVGTTSPWTNLSVTGTSSADVFFATATTSTTTLRGGLNVGDGALTYNYSTGETYAGSLISGTQSFDDDAGVVQWTNLPIVSAATGTPQSYTASIGDNPVLTVYGEATPYASSVARNTGIGIGTTSPYARLTVWGRGTGASSTIEVVNNASTTLFRLSDAGYAGFGTSTSAWLLQLATSTAPQLALTDPNGGTNAKHGVMRFANGNFYFGTSSDALSSTSTSLFLSGTNGGQLGLGTTTNYTNYRMNIGTNTGNNGLIVADNAVQNSFTSLNPGSVNISRNSSGSGAVNINYFNSAGVANGSPILTVGASGATNDFVIGNDKGGSTAAEVFRITNVNSTSNGFVGVGTTTPFGKLSIAALSGQTAPLLAIADASNNNYLTMTMNGALGLGTTTPNWMLQLASSTAPQLVLTDPSAGANLKHWVQRSIGGNFYLATSSDAFSTSTIPALSISSNGEFGIGTTTPTPGYSLSMASNLLVSGTLRTGAITSVTNTQHTFSNIGGAANVLITPNGVAPISYQNGSGSHWFQLRADGAIFQALTPGTTLNNLGTQATGFGSSTPQWRMQLATSSSAASNAIQLVLTDTAAGTNAKHWFYRSSGGYLYMGTSSDTTFSNSGTTTLETWSPAGYVGIGSTSPWKTLSVTGTMAVNGLTAEAGTKDALCIDSTTKEVQVNTGSPTCTVSSARYKHNIESLTATSGLALLRQLRPVSFETNDENQARVGFIAEEVNALDPRLVFYENDGITPRGVRYEEMTAVLAKSVQELDARLLNLENASSSLFVAENSNNPFSLTTLKTALSSFGIFVSDGLVHIANAAVDSLTVGSSTSPAGITLFDKTTKAPYCVMVNNGTVETTSGSCQPASISTSTIYVAPPENPISPPVLDIGTSTATSTDIVLDMGTSTATSSAATDLSATSTAPALGDIAPVATSSAIQ